MRFRPEGLRGVTTVTYPFDYTAWCGPLYTACLSRDKFRDDETKISRYTSCRHCFRTVLKPESNQLPR